MKWLVVLPIMVCAAGCASQPATVGQAASKDRASTTASHDGPAAKSVAAHSKTVSPVAPPVADGPLVAQLDVYQLTVPFGAISRNDEFWKHIDETRLDPPTYDLLVKNGMRMGVGENSDWKYFKELIDNYHAAAQKGVAGLTQEGTIELMLKSGVDYQDIFWFDGRNVLYGRTFEFCDDLMSVSFYPHQRAEGDTVVKICPMVRGLRKEFVFSVRNEEHEKIEWRRPEKLFDLRAAIQVQADHFLVFGTSRLSTLPSGAGQNFLVKAGNAEPVETVIILVPKAYRIGADSIAVPLSSTVQ